MNPAKGISASLFERAIDAAFTGVDVADAEVVKATLEKFKTENPAMIAAEGIGGPEQKGQPDAPGQFSGPNPFSKKSFNLTEGIKLMQSNPTLAKSLQEAAAKEPDEPSK